MLKIEKQRNIIYLKFWEPMQVKSLLYSICLVLAGQKLFCQRSLVIVRKEQRAKEEGGGDVDGLQLQGVWTQVDDQTGS